MAVALDLARLAEGRTSPNPMVGAVLVRNGKLVGRGFHRGPGTAHAEIEAIEETCRGGVTPPLQGTTLYATLEPCCPPKKGGRTPPCTDAILASGVRKVVIGMKDPDPRMRGRGIALLKKAGIKVRVGLLEKEGRALNEAYIVHRSKKRPFVILKMAATADGMVGVRGKHLKITGPEADAQVHALRDRVDAILVGRGTVEADDPRLTARPKGRRGKDPLRVVLDSRLSLSPKARLLRQRSRAATVVATTVSKGHRRVPVLKKAGAEILHVPKSAQGRVALAPLLRKLAERGVMSLLVEGGPEVWTSFLSAGAVDRIVVFVAPQSLDATGVPALSRLLNNRHWKVTSARRVGRDLMLEGTP
jgi:diaminohydroxyphosphoribosylaminopyrimidine deaminase/5-amino-6-(5-phosphoribosylamino)uracil reductase